MLKVIRNAPSAGVRKSAHSPPKALKGHWQDIEGRDGFCVAIHRDGFDLKIPLLFGRVCDAEMAIHAIQDFIDWEQPADAITAAIAKKGWVEFRTLMTSNLQW